MLVFLAVRFLGFFLFFLVCVFDVFFMGFGCVFLMSFSLYFFFFLFSFVHVFPLVGCLWFVAWCVVCLAASATDVYISLQVARLHFFSDVSFCRFLRCTANLVGAPQRCGLSVALVS